MHRILFDAKLMGVLLLTVAFVPAAGAWQPTTGTLDADATTHPGDDASLPTHAEATLELAKSIAALSGPSDSASSFAASIQAAKLATNAHADAMDLPPPARVQAPTHNTPSAAIATIVETLGGALTEEQAQETEALDGLAEPVSRALTSTLDAYHAYALAAHTAFDDANHDALKTATLTQPTSAMAAYEALDIEPAHLATVLAQRSNLLEATVDLEEAISTTPKLHHPANHGSLHVDVPPYVSIDLSGGNDVYLENYHVQVDVGGSDSYLNNAGGSMIGDCDLTIYAAALIDLGTDSSESDLFSAYPPWGDWRGDACGKNGGAHGPSAGLLVNQGGDDVYGDDSRWNQVVGFSEGVNGGGYGGGHGLLVDSGGDDVYNADDDGANGGASDLGASGLLVDGGGADVFLAGGGGTNGGEDETGHGTLVQLGAQAALPPLSTEDRLEAGGSGTNGGGDDLGVGVALDASFRDTVYEARSGGTNGGASDDARGALVDLFGDDVYEARNQGTNGGGYHAGHGFLYDADGDDDYVVGVDGVNGGGHDALGVPNDAVGLLIDAGGADTYDEGNDAYDCTNPDPCTIVLKGLLGARVDA